MNKKLLSLLAAVTIFGGVIAKDETAKKERKVTITSAIDATVTLEYTNSSYAGKVGRALHRNHEEVAVLKADQSIAINFDAKKLRVKSITIETENGKTQRFYNNKTTKLPLTITINKDGDIVTEPVLSFKEDKADKVLFVKTAAVIAAE